MNRAILFSGPLLVLYLLAEAAAAQGTLAPHAVGIGLAAIGVSFAPLLVARVQAGSRRVGVLGVALGACLVATLSGSPQGIAAMLGISALSIASATLVDLALTIPGPVGSTAGRRATRVAVWTVIALLAATAIPIRLGLHDFPGSTIARSLADPIIFGGLGILSLVTSLGIRLSRRRIGSSPESVAANTWSLTGNLIAGIAVGVEVITLSVASIDPRWGTGALALGCVALTAGHVAMVDPRRQLSAGESMRRFIAYAATIVVTAAIASLVFPELPSEPLPIAFATAIFLVGAVFLHRGLAAAAHRALSPCFGRLLDAAKEAGDGSIGATDDEDLARAVLPTLRRATGDVTAELALHLMGPDRVITIDAAGEPRIRKGVGPGVFSHHLAQHPGAVIVTGAIERQVVRIPDLRELVETLHQKNALAVVPLTFEGEVEGYLILPRGRRSTAATVEEIRALETLGARLGRIASLISSRARAHRRAMQLDSTTTDLRERVDALEEQLRRSQADTRTLRAGPSADQMIEPPVAYGPAMKVVLARADRLAPVCAPALLIGEAGTPLDPIAYRIHVASGRGDRPFVVGNCGAVRAERLRQLLFGDGESTGWLRTANGGTLLLVDIPALPRELQRDLSEVVATHHLQACDATNTEPNDVRLIATSRVPLTPLVGAGAFDEELARWLEEFQLTIPPLRGRPEDLESTLWLALDRAARRLGREPIGIEPEATETLARHDWPGNVDELEAVVEQALANATGPKITLEDLPPLVGHDAQRIGDPLDSTYQEFERRLLLRALERADQNRSEAARILGLKRTTFLDKLRRQSLYTSEVPSSGSATETAGTTDHASSQTLS